MSAINGSKDAQITVATALTIGRIVLTLPICWAILHDLRFISAALIALAGITDYLDGAVARARGEISTLGTALDPIADKILTACVLLVLAAAGQLPGAHIVPAIAIILRETLISGLRESAGASVKLPVTPLAKVKTAIQFIALLMLTIAPDPWGWTLLWSAAALTLWTGLSYVRVWLSTLTR